MAQQSAWILNKFNYIPAAWFCKGEYDLMGFKSNNTSQRNISFCGFFGRKIGRRECALEQDYK
jgi:hypothetical protein